MGTTNSGNPDPSVSEHHRPLELRSNEVLISFVNADEAEEFVQAFVDDSFGLISLGAPTNCSCCDTETPRSFLAEHIVRPKKEG